MGTSSLDMDAREFQLGEPGYPSPVAAFEDAPRALWIRGTVPSGRAVAVVGARRSTAQGREVARAVAEGLARRGIAVVSGGAQGIDGAAHRGALAAGGRTVVVVGTGIDVSYPPEHEPLFDEAVARGGAVVSQFPLGFGPKHWSFPARNRVIAALAEVVVVVEAQADSGALITAEAAKQYGRRVVALLGTPGCDALVGAGALAARSAEDILKRVEGVEAEGPPLPEDPRARLLYAALDETPRDLGEVAARAGMRAEEALALALDLELGGLAARAAGGRYLRLNW
jgi:DNA processing protein